MRGLFGAAALAALVAAGCGQSGEPQLAEAARAKMTEILETAAAAAQAERLGDVTWYTPDDLFEYINGMAAYFVDSGFERLAHSEWRAAGATGDAYVELDLYDMGRAEGALDILCDLRTEGTVYLPIGDEAHEAPAGPEFRIGRYYVKVVARRDVAGQKAFVRRLAEALAAAAPGGKSDEALLAPLRTRGMVPHTVAYTTKGFLGRPFLQGVYEATYTTPSGPVRVFYLPAPSEGEARAVMRKWRESAPSKSVRSVDVPGGFGYEEAYVGTVLVARKGRFVMGAIGKPDGALPLFKKSLSHVGDESLETPLR